jgi:hypothetical protein
MTRKEAAERLALEYTGYSTDDRYDHFKNGVLAGCEHAYSEKWIKVEDQLPPMQTHVDVWMNKDGGYRFANYYTGWISDSLMDDLKFHKITHWMPLPPSPKY